MDPSFRIADFINIFDGILFTYLHIVTL